MPLNSGKEKRPYGLWPSPITPAMLSQRIRLDEVRWNRQGDTLVWLEGRSGKGTLAAKANHTARRDLTVDLSVRGGVGYGGGEFSLSTNSVIFVERDGRLYQKALKVGQPQPITPPFGAASSPIISPSGKEVIYVFSDGQEDLLAWVDIDGQKWPAKLVSGADFYMQPCWHPDAETLAWIEWDHPNMPWDGTHLKTGKLAGNPPQIVEQNLIAGDEDTPVCQPEFSPDGNWLSYIISSGEWEDLVIMDIHSKEKHTLVEGNQFQLSTPAWVQGKRFYGWSHTSQRIFYLRNEFGNSELWSFDLNTRESTQIDMAPYTWLQQLSVSPVEDELVLIASGPQVPERVVRWNEEGLTVVARSQTESLSADQLPEPHAVEWTSDDGITVHGWFYPPTHPDFTADGVPPVIVNIHGGPTSAHDNRYTAEAVYFTSRGYGWMEVNYRGSTGYGRSYERALNQRWGEIDVEDAANAAKALAAQGLADPDRLVVAGGSAGGYTVLNALIRYPGRFKAGICRYGVSNLFTLLLDTHKFEAHYTDWLVGKLPEDSQRFHEWSPVFHADRIQDPLIIFQGSEDKVVVPDQSEQIVSALRKQGVPHKYLLYEGEGHGFRKQETLEDYYQQIERFLQQYVLFAPPSVTQERNNHG